MNKIDKLYKGCGCKGGTVKAPEPTPTPQPIKTN
jgi:hypothetical protein